MIRSWLKKIYFFLSPIRRSTVRIEDALSKIDEKAIVLEREMLESKKSFSQCLVPLHRSMVRTESTYGEILSRITSIERELLESKNFVNQQFDTLYRSTACTESKIDETLRTVESIERETLNLKENLSQVLIPIQQMLQTQSLLEEIIMHPSEDTMPNGKTEQDYIGMQQKHYNDPQYTPEEIVGNYEWHEEYPYETFLLYRYGDIRKPIFKNTDDKIALDFACGPGRMVKRMQKYFKQVDGCDISIRMIEEAKRRVPGAMFYVTNGNNLGDVPLQHYDFIYCTISMQHIASHKIRMNILKNMYRALKPGGKITLQMAYNPNYPYVSRVRQININDCQIQVYQKINMADWTSDDFGAQCTNGGHDVGIGENDLPQVKADFSGIFKNILFWFGDVSDYYQDLNGKHHGEYWAKNWIFIYGEKE